jgi:hypothetical protein
MLVVSILLVYCAATWAFVFGTMAFWGWTYLEPVKTIAFNEMCLAGLFTLVGLAGFVVALWNSLKERREKRHDTGKTTTS